MTKQAAASVIACALMAAAPVRAQQPGQSAPAAKPSPEGQSPRRAGVPVRVQVVLSRYDGERKVSSMPYALVVNAAEGPRSPSNLNMVAQVPVPGVAGGAPPMYKDIGTKITCYAMTTTDDRFEVTVTVSDTSVYGDGQTQLGSKSSDIPSFRTFSSSETLTLKDGQTAQFTAATDKLTGETVKVDVTLSVLK